ncbi:hypothetical protein SAMN05428949_0887 [Chitinophaga sp. YR627]|uniref:hypothetical protein n=1 Tax=Chitinophaga sp. YR627 TaxID=1881041 RepID=UPI0008EA37DC|nr:hypothetical protein [Chitinophaga sp. YR627]SFM81389.1 hypothetical protein SAMN05428949_0887 [Chitinophaga sp. YR627]
MSLQSKHPQHTNTPLRSAAGQSNAGGIARPAVSPLQKMSSESLPDEEPLLQRVAMEKGYHAAVPAFGAQHQGGNGVQLMSRTLPASQAGPVQRMKKPAYDTLNNLFKPQVKWPDFHRGQLAFQGVAANLAHTAADPYDFTTFGTEYEMIPYKGTNAIANTAHIKLAEGVGMPVKAGVKEVLVTDSDNVIEYVSPVFMLPLEKANKNTTTQAVDYIAQVKKKLADFKKDVHKGGFSNFEALLGSAPMQFTAWQIMQKLDISFREIDENTNVERLKGFGNTLADIKGIQLGFDMLAKNPKHKELNNETVPGSAMQTTVLLPLDVVAKMIRVSMDSTRDKEQQAAAPVAPGKKGGKAAAPKVQAPGTDIKGAAGDLIRGLMAELHGIAGKEGVIDLIYLFGQRLSLVLEASNAVKFQAHYQATKFNPPAEVEDEVAAPAPEGGDVEEAAPEPGKITDADLLEKYDEEELAYNEKKAAGKLSEIPNNFHSAHSSIKDRLSIWTRIHLDDLVVAIGKNLNEDNKSAFKKAVGAVTGKFEGIGDEIFSKIKTALSGAGYVEHAPVHFLDENEEYIDLRQDTLRDIQVIDGRPWVLIEIRDLKDTTLNALKEQGTPRAS